MKRNNVIKGNFKAKSHRDKAGLEEKLLLGVLSLIIAIIVVLVFKQLK